MLTFHIVTIFPKIFDSYFGESIINRARERKIVRIKMHGLRDYAADRHKKVDDKPYGGGAGMVLMAEPIIRAVADIKSKIRSAKTGQRLKVVVFSAKGKQFNQKTAYDWSRKYNKIIMIAGRYEGIDERVIKILKATEISIGPYILTDGEVPAMIVVSAVTRLLPGAIRLESLAEESHWNLLIKSESKTGLEYPHYTRPEVLEYKSEKYRVPKILLSGHHEEIKKWRWHLSTD